MIKFDAANIAGIEEEDGTVICRECMDEEQRTNLSEFKIISVSEIEKHQIFYFCDYCEERL